MPIAAALLIVVAPAAEPSALLAVMTSRPADTVNPPVKSLVLLERTSVPVLEPLSRFQLAVPVIFPVSSSVLPLVAAISIWPDPLLDSVMIGLLSTTVPLGETLLAI